jgi:hypothetical protein
VRSATEDTELEEEGHQPGQSPLRPWVSPVSLDSSAASRSASVLRMLRATSMRVDVRQTLRSDISDSGSRNYLHRFKPLTERSPGRSVFEIRNRRGTNVY